MFTISDLAVYINHQQTLHLPLSLQRSSPHRDRNTVACEFMSEDSWARFTKILERLRPRDFGVRRTVRNDLEGTKTLDVRLGELAIIKMIITTICTCYKFPHSLIKFCAQVDTASRRHCLDESAQGTVYSYINLPHCALLFLSTTS